jgi:hypothetical protein
MDVKMDQIGPPSDLRRQRAHHLTAQMEVAQGGQQAQVGRERAIQSSGKDTSNSLIFAIESQVYVIVPVALVHGQVPLRICSLIHCQSACRVLQSQREQGKALAQASLFEFGIGLEREGIIVDQPLQGPILGSGTRQGEGLIAERNAVNVGNGILIAGANRCLGGSL